jgi:hypothetical protein
MRRYLVVIPKNGDGDVAFDDVETDRDPAEGDELLVGDLLLRVQVAVAVAEDGYDGTLICTPEDRW